MDFSVSSPPVVPVFFFLGRAGIFSKGRTLSIHSIFGWLPDKKGCSTHIVGNPSVPIGSMVLLYMVCHGSHQIYTIHGSYGVWFKYPLVDKWCMGGWVDYPYDAFDAPASPQCSLNLNLTILENVSQVQIQTYQSQRPILTYPCWAVINWNTWEILNTQQLMAMIA